MDIETFNNLLKLQKYDEVARHNLITFCMAKIKKRLLFRGVDKDLEHLLHSILVYFMDHLPKKCVIAPGKYLNRSTDNYLSNYKKKLGRQVPLTTDIAYEPYFEEVEKSELYNKLLVILGELNARIIYLHYIEEVKESEISGILGIDISYSAIRQRICRSKKILQKKYKIDVTKSEL